ncbi:prepilin-type N-terminal cleavage/methylation domain-containing protein [Paucibacter sp. B2R-40]|uniref:pilus assembly FimT family protein n=1 Tax=Paucibacter sp. B2R-40 TaxID=2893554 RepID=UPI0021E48E84|nr:prepilin-type N-terminal cleavage/methylation domain-containing protein [Paucibacter sp. B2R-40]MCV2355580.1 prepilin-type N-terminal cleavage/methylation domain-containing protein [Paucibacter sp. B2R-40]
MLAKMSRRHFRGVTLTEVLVVVAVSGILLGLAAPSLADMLNRRRVQMVAETLSNDLAYARAEAGLGRNLPVFVKFAQPSDMTCYTIFINGLLGNCLCNRPSGTACSGTKLELRTYQVPTSMGVSMNVVGQTDLISFEAPRMSSSAPEGFAVTVAGMRGSKLQVQVNAMGRVSICVPAGGNFSGVPACPA